MGKAQNVVVVRLGRQEQGGLCCTGWFFWFGAVSSAAAEAHVRKCLWEGVGSLLLI